MVADELCLRIRIQDCSNVPGSTTNLGQSQADTPDLTLVLETILADELQLRVPGVEFMSVDEQT